MKIVLVGILGLAAACAAEAGCSSGSGNPGSNGGGPGGNDASSADAAGDAPSSADGATSDSGTGGDAGPLPDLGACGFTPTDHCPDFHGFQPMAGGPYATFVQSIASAPVDPNSAIMLQVVWYSPQSAPAGWNANGQAPSAAGGTYLSGYLTQHLWPQGDMPYQVLDGTIKTESGPQKSSQFFSYGGTTASGAYAYPWNEGQPIEGVHGSPNDQRDLAQSIAPWSSSPAQPPSPWTTVTPGNGGNAAGTVANRFQIEQYSDGTLYGVRFYKAAGDTGTHVAYVWDASGNVLGKGTAANESASGWQYAWFATPVSISQFTPYLAGVSYSAGAWTKTGGALAKQYSNDAALILPADSAMAPNGLTSTAVDGTAPTTAASQTYFWVDPILTISADRHALMYDRSANVAYEAYSVYRKSSGIEFPFDKNGQTTVWRAGGGAGIFDFTKGPLHPFGGVGNSTAGGLPVTPLILRYDELSAATHSGSGGPGDVGHAIRMTSLGIASMAAPPARNWAYNGRSDGMPYGARVRVKQSWLDAKTLDPAHAVTNYHYFDAHPQAQVLLNTLAKYGAVMDDGGLLFQLSTSPQGGDAWDATGMTALFDNVKADAFEIAQIPAGYAITGPATATAGQAATLTVSLEPAGDVDGNLWFWLTDGSDGAFSSNPVHLAAGQTSATVTYTPGSKGAKMIRALATTDAAGGTLSARYPPGGPAGLESGMNVTSLAQAVDAASTTITVSTTHNPYDSSWNLPFWVVIDDEVMKVTAVSAATTWTVVRADQAFGGAKQAAAHAAGAKVAMACAGTGTGPGYSLEFFPYVLGPAVTITAQ